jgi:hypothetical protein
MEIYKDIPRCPVDPADRLGCRYVEKESEGDLCAHSIIHGRSGCPEEVRLARTDEEMRQAIPDWVANLRFLEIAIEAIAEEIQSEPGQ